MIELKNLNKYYKDKVAIDDLSFNIKSGVVTGFLGPNGAGKSTTMRMILNLVKPSRGEIIIDGKSYMDLNYPILKIGALIDADAIDPKLTAFQHLKLIATASEISNDQVIGMLEKTGLEKVMDKQIGEFSLGMKQRLGIAAALLGNPETVILDEPFNGLDVDGIKWLRNLIKDLAKEGKAVLVSSHLMSEVEAIAERIIVLAQGKLIADMSVEEISQKSFSGYLRIKSENNSKLGDLLKKNGAYINRGEEDSLHIRNMEVEKVGILAKENYVAIFELIKVQPSLEQLFSELTEGKVDYISRQEPIERRDC